MLNRVVEYSLKNRLVIIVAMVVLLIVGTYIAINMPIDVFPDLTAPTVTILTEAHGLAPEEVETLVTFPIETALNGASGVRRIRSVSIHGLSTIWVEFDWGTNIYLARQIVSEKLQTVQGQLPEDVDRPAMAPITSIMGEIMLVGITSDTISPMDLRTIADFNLRRRLLSVTGVSQILVYGGEVKQYQILIDPDKLRAYDITLQQVHHAAEGSNINASGGFFVESGQEYLIKGLGRIRNLNELEKTVIATRNQIPIKIGDVAQVIQGPAIKLGAASVNMKPAVMLVLSKQPKVNTLTLSKEIDEAIDEVRRTLPEGVTLSTNIFRQSDFIQIAVKNVIKALFWGAILILIILFLFLMNFRMTFISAMAIPLSLIIAVLILKLLNFSINTMTLGGMAIAIGVLVDDGIIFVENVYRRLKENALKPVRDQRSSVEVICRAAREIHKPIITATMIVIAVFVPFFLLSGIEGRLLKPLGFAYILSIFSSLVVAVTVTPALYSFLMPSIDFLKKRGDSFVVAFLKPIYRRALEVSLKRGWLVFTFAILLFLAAAAIIPFLGRSFLPEFNEGTLNISMATVPGTSLEESNKLGLMVENILLSHPEVLSTARRTGRTELDEHSMGSHASEMEVRIDLRGRSKHEVLQKFREALSLVPGTNITIGQPISHRIDHMLSGTRANIAVKIFGPDLYNLRSIAEKIKEQMQDIEGMVDLSVELQTDIPQVHIKPNRERLALYGVTTRDLDEMLDISFLGVTASQILEGQKTYDLIVRYDPEYRKKLEHIQNAMVDTPMGVKIPLTTLADITIERGPNFISRENVQRKIVVQANVSGRDLRGVIDEAKEKISENISLPQDYFVVYGGQFESEQEAARMMIIFSTIAILAILLLLYLEFSSLRISFLIMVNLPLALIGGVFSVFFTSGIISIASMVGFITLFGIAVRNGIILISHYQHLIGEEGKSLYEAVMQGSLERLSPILMTALTTGLALLPLALQGGRPGNEIQSPLAIVVLGGLITATFLNIFVLPALFLKLESKGR
jgi:CzcA family heavy metal efflux pump